MTKKNRFVKIMAVLALLGIIIGIIGTGLLIMFSKGNTTEEQTLTPEQYLELQELMNSQSGSIDSTGTGTMIGTGETE